MDIEEIIIETLRLAEQIELDSEGAPRIYTCIVKASGTAAPALIERVQVKPTNDGVFSDVVLTGELCVCAHNEHVALLLFFLLNGIFDYGENRLEWYTQVLEVCINTDYDDINAELVMQIWAKWYGESIIEIKEHNITQPIVVYPILQGSGSEHRGLVTLTPSISDIWTVPRIRRQFTD